MIDMILIKEKSTGKYRQQATIGDNKQLLQLLQKT